MAVVTVAVDDLFDWLAIQTPNTVDTSYELNVTGLSYGKMTLFRNSIEAFPYIYVDLRHTELPDAEQMDYHYDSTFESLSNLVYSPSIPENVEYLDFTFHGCTNLKEVPDIPDSVVSMSHCFVNCSSLTIVNNIPSSVVDLNSCFYACEALTTWNQKDILNENADFEQAFFVCENIVNINTDCPYELKNQLIEIHNDSYYAFPANPENLTYRPYSEVVEVPFSDLNNELVTWSTNTTSTPYKLNVTGLTANDLGESDISGTLGYILKQNNAKYVDLSNTEIPNTVTSMEFAFLSCSSLVSAPVISNSVTNIGSCFSNCTSLTTVPNIPNGVTNMNSTFRYCTSFTTSPVIPDSVTVMSYTFGGCTPLVNAPVIPNGVTDMDGTFTGTSLTTAPTIPNSVTNMSSTFWGCTSLTTVPNIPSSVADMFSTFKNCSALEEITLFEADLESITSNNNGEDCFSGCTSLTKIGVPVSDQPSESSDWHCFRLKFDSTTVQGKVYDKTKTAVTISQTTVTKSTLKLPIETDELWFPSGYTDAQIDAIIEKAIQYRYTYFNDSNVLDPANKNFVLWADNPSNVKTNIPTNVSSASGVLPVANGGTGQTDLANVNVGSATSSGRVSAVNITIKTGSTTKAKISLNTLMTWLMHNNRGYIPSGVSCYRIITTTWSYAYNDILQLTIDDVNYELQLAGVVIEFMGNATDYQTGMFRLRIHSSTTTSFTATSGYTIFPVNHIAEYTCNGSSYSPTWEMLLGVGDSARALSGTYTCSTAADTAAKTVTVPGFKLAKGARLTIVLSNANTAASALTLNVNGTGAKTIRWNGTVTSTSTYAMTATTYMCYYDGTYWNMDSGFEAYSARIANYATSAGTATTATTANKIRTSAPSSPANGDIWIE